MRVSPLMVRAGVGAAAIAVLALLRYAPWTSNSERSAMEPAGGAAEARETLTVGFLPVT